MDHWLQNDAENREISLENFRRKDSSAYVDIDEANENGAESNNSHVSEATNLTEWQNLRSDGSRKKGGKKEKKKTPEGPKVVLKRNGATAFRHFVLFHAIPVGGAMALIVVNVKPRLYGDDGTWVPAFQFVAKAHEILMQASIITVMAAYLQYLLVHKRGVPFGAVFSAYRVTDMSYLWSREFLAALTTPSFPGFMKIAFFLFIPFSILLAAAVGPSSAIAMQPRQANLTVPGWRFVLEATSDFVYPGSFGEAGPALNFSNPWRSELSPAAGWEYIRNLPATNEDTEIGLQWIKYHPSNPWRPLRVMPKLYSTQLKTYNPDMDFYVSRAQPVARTLYVQHAPNATFATVQHVPVALTLDQARQMRFTWFKPRPAGSVTSIEMPQAYASVLCRLNSIINENDSRQLQFPDTYVTGCGDGSRCGDRWAMNKAGGINYTAITRRQIWDQAREHPQGRINWADDIRVSSPVAGTALGAIVVHPTFCEMNYTFLTTSACVVGARWANTTSYLQETYNREFRFRDYRELTIKNSISPQSPSTLPRWSQPSVNLSRVWAESLNPVTDVQNRTVADNLLRWLPITDNLCPTNGSYLLINGDRPEDMLMRPIMHETLIASLVANGMSHPAGAVQWGYSLAKNANGTGPKDGNGTQPRYQGQGIVLTFQARVSAYAWNLDGTPIKIALPILFLYCVYALVYVLYTLVTGRSSMTWGSISGLVALAINSAPTEALEHTSAGIERMSTFRKLVSVREVEEDKGLKLVFMQDEEKTGPYRRVAMGRAY